MPLRDGVDEMNRLRCWGGSWHLNYFVLRVIVDILLIDGIETIEEREKMQYVTSVERIGIAKGRVVGRVEGRVEGEARILKRQLERRFGVLPEWASDQLVNAKEEELEAWSVAVLTAPTLDAVFREC